MCYPLPTRPRKALCMSGYNIDGTPLYVSNMVAIDTSSRFSPVSLLPFILRIYHVRPSQQNYQIVAATYTFSACHSILQSEATSRLSLLATANAFSDPNSLKYSLASGLYRTPSSLQQSTTHQGDGDSSSWLIITKPEQPWMH